MYVCMYVCITQQIQKKAGVGKTEEDKTGLQIEVLKIVPADRFSKFIAAVCSR